MYQDGRSGAAVSVTAKTHTTDGQYNVLVSFSLMISSSIFTHRTVHFCII